MAVFAFTSVVKYDDYRVEIVKVVSFICQTNTIACDFVVALLDVQFSQFNAMKVHHDVCQAVNSNRVQISQLE